MSLVALNADDEGVKEVAESLYNQLQSEGIEVLYDDRAESAGVKFNDSDLLGLPIRLVVSPRNLKNNVVEVKLRSEADAITVQTDEVISKVKEFLNH